MAKKELEVITVHPKGTDRRVVLFERDPAHPTGEAFITNNGKSYQVAETKEVRRLLAEDVLVKGEASAEVQKAASSVNPPGRRPGRVVESAPELRPATDSEERRAKPPLLGETEKQTARVPKTGG